MVRFPMVRARALILATLPLAGLLAAATLVAGATAAMARKASHAAHPPAAEEQEGKAEKGLMKLDPAELMTQVCDLGAMKALGRDAAYKKTDRVLIDAASPPKIAGDKVTGEGGALRMGDQWFRFSYSCTLTPNHMNTADFRYQVTGPIPEAKWAEFGLWH